MISSLSSLGGMVTKKPAPIVEVVGTEFYYTFDTADYNSGTYRYKNNITGAYDLKIYNSTAAMTSSTTNITGTTDLALNGTNQFADITSIQTGTSGITISVWFRSNNSANNATVFDLGRGTSRDNIELYLENTTNKPVFRIYKGATPFVYTGTSFIDLSMNTDNSYRHIGIVMNPNGTFKYYLNGGLYNTTTGNQYPNPLLRENNYVGTGYNGAYLKGGIGEFRMYNTMKTDADMLSYYKSNTRIDNSANMFCHYKFLSGDLIQNGIFPKIRNHATGIYDLSFNRTTLITITDPNVGAISGNVGLASQASKFGGEYFYSYCTTAAATFGANLPSITTPTTSGITVCFWFKLVSAPLQWAVLFGMNPLNGPDAASQATRVSIAVNTNQSGNPMVAGGNSNSTWSFPSSTSPTALTQTTWHFYYIRTTLSGVPANNLVEHCVDMKTFTTTSPITNQTTKGIYFKYIKLLCAPALDVPAYAQIDDFRFYKIQLTDDELRAIYTKTNKL
jgi:hypothetical protein